MEHQHSQTFSIPEIRSFVPERAKPFIVIAFLIIIQFSGGVYLSSVSEMVGTTALMQEDIMMAGYASLIGMALNFVLMFRIKCAIPPKTTYFVCGIVIILANLICMNTHSVPVLVITCLIAGFFRMQATFQCNSTIQLWLTPTRDMSVFFSWVYLIVNGTIQLSGLTTVFISSFSEWHYMQWFIIGLMLFMLLIVMLCYKNYSTMPKIPLIGIDWLGMFMWGAAALSALFICIYGKHYDWWKSEYIWAATIATVVLVALNLWRASFIRHAYIFPHTFRHPIILQIIATIIIADILLAPGHIFEHILMEGMFRYDAINLISLNWIALGGSILGVFFTWRVFAIKKWSYQRMLLISFICIFLYLLYFYFYIDYNLPKEMLFFPIFIRNFGYIILSISLLTANTRLPFPFEFFQGVTIQNMFSAIFGAAIGNAVVGRLLDSTSLKNFNLISASFDRVNTDVNTLPIKDLYHIAYQHATIISMKEIYGWLLILSILCIIFLLLRKSDIKPNQMITHPKFKNLRKRILKRL